METKLGHVNRRVRRSRRQREGEKNGYVFNAAIKWVSVAVVVVERYDGSAPDSTRPGIYAQEFLETMRVKCFEKCITKPGSSLSGSESSCIFQHMLSKLARRPPILHKYDASKTRKLEWFTTLPIFVTNNTPPNCMSSASFSHKSLLRTPAMMAIGGVVMGGGGGGVMSTRAVKSEQRMRERSRQIDWGNRKNDRAELMMGKGMRAVEEMSW
ncbi:Tim10-like [Dillenia turbinata]|uniref:Tim10-like n=1 Tax=Dillenia turbinata TaxID=194707 RepID=A0AAN8VL24_9MAGN